MDHKKELHGILTTMLNHGNTKVVDYDRTNKKETVTLKLAGKGQAESFSLQVIKHEGSHDYELKFAHARGHNTNYIVETLDNEESATLLWMPLIRQVNAIYADRNHLSAQNSLKAFNAQFGEN